MLHRLMEASDYSALRDLWSRFPGNALTGADSREGFERFLEANGRFCFVAVDSGAIAGSVMAGSDTRRGYIYHLAVAEEHRCSGTGRTLMTLVEDALRDAGIEKLHLFIFRDNPAVAFYSKLGWQVREDIHVMSKILGDAPVSDAHGATSREPGRPGGDGGGPICGYLKQPGIPGSEPEGGEE